MTYSMKRLMGFVLAFSLYITFQPISFCQVVQTASDVVPVTVKVTAVYHAPPDEDDLRVLFSDILTEELRISGHALSDTPEIVLLVSAIPVPRDSVALHVTFLQTLPNAIVDFAAEHEVFYLDKDTEEFPAEGKKIRQYVSREFIAQFATITDQYSSLVARNELRFAAKDVVEQMMKPYEPHDY